MSKQRKLHLRRNVKLAPLSTFGIGGRTQHFCWAKNPSELVEAARWAKKREMPYRIFAGGSNVVFPDKKIKSLVIRFFGGKIKPLGKDALLADAGVLLQQVIDKSISLGLRGIETLSGIPGTIGGAVVGNAGAYGHSISEAVDGMEVWDGKKTLWLNKDECKFQYRKSIFSAKGGSASRSGSETLQGRMTGGKHKNLIVLRIKLRFIKRDAPKNLKKISKSIINIRTRKYKPGLKCPGSFFKNVLLKDVSKKSLKLVDQTKIIEGKIPAGYLLERVDAKNTKVGQAQVSDFHGNLIMNKNGATAAQVKKLAQILKKRVYKKFGIVLEEEIIYF